MARVKAKVTIYKSKVNDLTRAAQQAVHMTAEAIHTEVVQAQVIPRLEGTLQNESTFVDSTDISKGKAYIVSDTPYARRLYYHPEYNFTKNENPNAKGKWFEDWMPGGKKSDFGRKAYKEFLKRLGGL